MTNEVRGLLAKHGFDQDPYKANRGRLENGEPEQKDPVASSIFLLNTLDHAETRALQALCGHFRNRELRFWHHLRAITASASGLGLTARDRITMVAQRDVDFTSLAMLANMMRANFDDPLHTVSLSSESTGGNAPDQLAAWLDHEQEVGNLTGDTILLILPSWAFTPEWEGIGTDNLGAPLKQWLGRHAKRLIIGVEPPADMNLSLMVHPENNILPLPWGIPFIARMAARGRFNPSRLDDRLIETLDRESAWQSQLDDIPEHGRYIQISAFKNRNDGPEELTAALMPLLGDKVISLEEQWQEGRELADSLMGIGVSAPPAGNGLPAIITRSVLCTVAFAPGLPVGRFLKIVRTSLPLDQRVELSDLTTAERENLILLAGLQGSEHKTLPPLQTIRDFFQSRADRIYRACRIEANDEGNMERTGSWHSFPLASYICRTAPSTAIDYANRLLTQATKTDDLATGDINPMLRIMAHLLFRLPSAMHHQQLALWLLQCGLHNVPDDERLLVLEQASRADCTAVKIKQASLATSIRIAKSISQTAIAFLSELRKVASGTDHRPQNTQDTTLVLQTMLSEIRKPQIGTATALAMILLDEEHRPGEHATYESFLQERLVPKGQMDFAIALVSRFFSTPIAGGAEGRFACACRLLSFLETAAKREASHPVWRTARDKILSLILNEDIRWPPNDKGLLAYRFHRTSIATELVALIKQDLPASSPLYDGRRIILERFLAKNPAQWLAESWQGWAAKDAPSRLYDTVLILLDGPPSQARYWQTQSYKVVADRILDSLMIICRAEHLASLADYAAQLQQCDDFLNPPLADKPALRLYGLYWSALLLFWRFRLFGVEALPTDDPKSEQFKAFLDRLCQTTSTQTLMQIIEGLQRLQKALKTALIDVLSSRTDPATHSFYMAKYQAAEKLANFLQKRLPQENQSATALTTRSQRLGKINCPARP